MRVMSLFSGVGGLEKGLEDAGMTVVGQCEIDDFCQNVLAKHWPNVWRHGDIRTLTGDLIRENCGHVDVLCGGPPCQPVSRAGRKKRKADERWLWPEYFRLLRDIRPAYAIMENPTGLFDGGFGDILGWLAESGYDAEWQVISASILGAAHLRERIFVVAYPNSDGMERCRNGILAGPVGQGWSSSQAFVPGRDSTWKDIAFGPGDGCALVSRRLNGDAGELDAIGRIQAIGNSVSPIVAQWVGERIMSVHKK